jgi:hypothetical protein
MTASNHSQDGTQFHPDSTWKQWIFSLPRFSLLRPVFKLYNCVLSSNTHMIDTNCLISPKSLWSTSHWKLKLFLHPLQTNQVSFSYVTSNARAKTAISAALWPYRFQPELHLTSLQHNSFRYILILYVRNVFDLYVAISNKFSQQNFGLHFWFSPSPSPPANFTSLYQVTYTSAILSWTLFWKSFYVNQKP